VRIARGERGTWQRRFWEHAIRDKADYAAHVDYCHINPVKQGFVQRAVDWPYSTFHHYVERIFFRHAVCVKLIYHFNINQL
jgi:putative transposase